MPGTASRTIKVNQPAPRPSAPQPGWRFDSLDGQGVIEVCIAGDADLDLIDRIEADSFIADRFVRRNLRRMLRGRKTLFLLARISGRPAGYLALAFRRGSQRARIYSIAVSRTSRRQGVAGALLAAATGLAQARGCLKIGLEVRKSNLAAIRLYQNAGFSLQQTRQAYYEDGEAALILEADVPHSPGEL